MRTPSLSILRLSLYPTIRNVPGHTKGEEVSVIHDDCCIQEKKPFAPSEDNGRGCEVNGSSINR